MDRHAISYKSFGIFLRRVQQSRTMNSHCSTLRAKRFRGMGHDKWKIMNGKVSGPLLLVIGGILL